MKPLLSLTRHDAGPLPATVYSQRSRRGPVPTVRERAPLPPGSGDGDEDDDDPRGGWFASSLDLRRGVDVRELDGDALAQWRAAASEPLSACPSPAPRPGPAR